MPVDGEAMTDRVLGFLTGKDLSGLEPSVQKDGVKRLAFNATVLRSLLGTPFMPDSTGAELYVEDVGEYSYALDRTFCQLVSGGWLRKLKGVRIGRFSNEVANTTEFGMSQPDIVRHWCQKAGVPVLGTADIGHDTSNKIVPFGTWTGT
jgi:muramoyltetrapeptide carboxypeptidase